MTKKTNETWDLEKLNARIPGLMLSQRQIIVSLLSQARKEGIENCEKVIGEDEPCEDWAGRDMLVYARNSLRCEQRDLITRLKKGEESEKQKK